MTEKESIVNDRNCGYFHPLLGKSLRAMISHDPLLLFDYIIKDLKRERRSRVSLIDFQGTRYIVKHYFVKNFLFLLRRLVLPSLAVKIRQRGNLMEQNHISTPLLLAAVDSRQKFVYRGTTCLYEYVKPDKDKKQLQKEFENREKREVIIVSVTSFLAKMHQAGIFHGDAKISNFLWVEHSGNVDIHVIDLDDCRFMKKLAVRQRIADLANLVFSFAWWNNKPNLAADCLQVYLQVDSSWCRDKGNVLKVLQERVRKKLAHRRQRQKV